MCCSVFALCSPCDIDKSDLQQRFRSFSSWLADHDPSPPVTKSTIPSLVAVGLHTVLELLPKGRKSGGLNKSPTVRDIIASVDKKIWADSEALDVRLILEGEKWVSTKDFDSSTVDPANRVLEFLLGKSTEIEQDIYTRCGFSSLMSVVAPSVLYDLASAVHIFFLRYVINPVAEAAERKMKRPATRTIGAETKKQKTTGGRTLNTGAAFSVMPKNNVTPKHEHHQGAINALWSEGEKLWILWPTGVEATDWTKAGLALVRLGEPAGGAADGAATAGVAE